MKVNDSHIDDQANWLQLQRGVSSALGKLYDTYADSLFNYGCRFTHQSEVLEDAIQDLFAELWTKRAKLCLPNSVKAYLLKSFRQKLLWRLSQRSKLHFDGDFFEAQAVTDSSGSKYNLSDDDLIFSVRLKTAIKSLSVKQQEAITLKYTENLTHDEIAEVMHIKKQTLYNLLHSAIQRLSVILKKEHYPAFAYLTISLLILFHIVH